MGACGNVARGGGRGGSCEAGVGERWSAKDALGVHSHHSKWFNLT